VEGNNLKKLCKYSIEIISTKSYRETNFKAHAGID
jgi:hypothetical protein